MKRLLVPLLFIAAACASSSDRPVEPAAMKVGTYSSDAELSPVGVIPTATLHDAQRNKDVEVSIDYPTRGGPFPVIVFSHAYGSSNRAYEPLISYWTSNGYVCIRPKHADAGALRETMREMMPPGREEGRNRRNAAARAAQQPPQRNPEAEVWGREHEPQWRDRVADVKLVLDSLDELERRFPELQGKMDHAKIGVAGHSYGAFTAMLIGGMQTFGNPPLQLADARVRAVIAMSPQGIAANRGTTARSWAAIHIPMLFMTGSNDRGATEAEDANWRKEAFENSAPGDKYFVLIEGAGHLTFTGMGGFATFEQQRPMTSPYGMQQPQRGISFMPGRRAFDIIKITSLAFWDAYLKGDTSARDLLQPAKYDESFSGATMMEK